MKNLFLSLIFALTIAPVMASGATLSTRGGLSLEMAMQVFPGFQPQSDGNIGNIAGLNRAMEDQFKSRIYCREAGSSKFSEWLYFGKRLIQTDAYYVIVGTYKNKPAILVAGLPNEVFLSDNPTVVARVYVLNSQDYGYIDSFVTYNSRLVEGSNTDLRTPYNSQYSVTSWVDVCIQTSK